MFRSSHITSKCYLSIEAGECGFSWFTVAYQAPSGLCTLPGGPGGPRGP